MRYHINNNGDAGRCQATMNCPFGGSDEHYDTPEEAQAAFEASQTTNSVAILQRNSEDYPPVTEPPLTDEEEEELRGLDAQHYDNEETSEDYDDEPDYEGIMENRFDEEAAIQAAENRYERSIYGDY